MNLLDWATGIATYPVIVTLGKFRRAHKSVRTELMTSHVDQLVTGNEL